MVDLSGEVFSAFCTVEVEGTSQVQSAHPPSTTLSTTSQSPAAGSSYSSFQSVVHQNRKSTGGFSLKVVQATITHITGKGRPNFQMQGQSFIELCEKTANVGYILTQVQREFGLDHIVVTADGLEVKDSSGTQGIILSHSYLQIVICHRCQNL